MCAPPAQGRSQHLLLLLLRMLLRLLLLLGHLQGHCYLLRAGLVHGWLITPSTD